MEVVVTGATSFIGAVTVRQLLAQGHRVHGVVRPGSGNLARLLDEVSGRRGGAAGGAESSAGPDPAGQVQPVEAGDSWDRLHLVELDLREIGNIARQVPSADAWVHIGWDGAGSDNRKKRNVQQQNVVYALASVRAAGILGCRRFLFTGSQAEYGVYHDWVNEETPCHPVSEYGIAKCAFASQAEGICRLLGMEYVHMRIFSVYGPGDHPWSLVQSCLRTWLAGGEMALGACTQQWNFLYIQDAVSALVHLLTEGAPGVYNVAGNDTRILRDYIEEMYRLCGSRGSFVYGERPENAEGPADLMPDIRKILSATTWRPETTFAEGIHELLHCMQDEAS